MSGIPLKKMAAESVNAHKVAAELIQSKYAAYWGDHQPNCSAPNGYGDPTGTAGDLNRCLFGGSFGLRTQYHVKGTQTLLAPLLDTTGLGLDISQDQTDNDGVEHVFGANNTRGAFVATVGTHNPYIRVKFHIVDVSGTDDCAVGFRKVEAAQGNIDDYDEAAFVNVILGDVKVETILNAAATVTTDSGENWADAAEHTVEVQVIGRRAVFLYDGLPLSGIPAFSFDSAEVIVPFFFFLQATTTPGKVFWREVEVGLLKTKNANGLPSA